MAKYSKKSQDKVEKTMHELKHGKLKSGTGKKVTSRKQAIAIGLSEARKEGAKVPAKKSGSSKSSAKKSASKKSAPRKGAAKKSASKKSAPRKSASKKPAAKKKSPAGKSMRKKSS